MTIAQPVSDATIDYPFSTAQAFCRLMLQISLIAIPVYLGLFMIAIPFDSDAGVKRGLLLFSPVVIFVAASAFYSIGYLTPITSLEREGFDGIAKYGSSRLSHRIIRRKTTLILLGSGALSLGILSSALMLIKAHL